MWNWDGPPITVETKEKEMKKYACYTDGKSRVVVASLRKAGFKVEDACFDADIISINTWTDAYCSWSGAGSVNYYVDKGVEWLPPSYVLEHAAELDGAKRAWEVAPCGHRLVTDEERVNCLKPYYVKCFTEGCANNDWKDMHEEGGSFDSPISTIHYAIPTTTTLKPKATKEVELQVDGKMVSESTIKSALKAYFN